jgi:hypothetical protein
MRRDAAGEIEALEGTLLLSANRDKETSASISGRLENLAERFAAPGVRPTTPTVDLPVQWNAAALAPMIDEGLRRLEQATI